MSFENIFKSSHEHKVYSLPDPVQAMWLDIACVLSHIWCVLAGYTGSSWVTLAQTETHKQWHNKPVGGGARL